MEEKNDEKIHFSGSFFHEDYSIQSINQALNHLLNPRARKSINQAIDLSFTYWTLALDKSINQAIKSMNALT